MIPKWLIAEDVEGTTGKRGRPPGGKTGQNEVYSEMIEKLREVRN